MPAPEKEPAKEPVEAEGVQRKKSDLVEFFENLGKENAREAGRIKVRPPPTPTGGGKKSRRKKSRKSKRRKSKRQSKKKKTYKRRR